jgi:hypothetical protein
VIEDLRSMYLAFIPFGRSDGLFTQGSGAYVRVMDADAEWKTISCLNLLRVEYKMVGWD